MTRPRKDPDYEAGFKKAAADRVDREQLAHEYGGAAAPAGLPTTAASGDGKHHLRMAPTQIVSPDGDQVAQFGSQGVAVCGQCRYYDLEKGREEIIRQRFGEKVVRDYEWKLKHLGDLDGLGLCGASGGEIAVQFVSRACDQFRPSKG